MASYFGIDGGGSGSRWAVLGSDGSWNSGEDGPPIQVATLGIEETAARIRALLRQAWTRRERPDKVVAGLAGAGGPDLRIRLEDLLHDSSVSVVGDTVTGAAAALGGGPGVAIFAGTGSFAVARDQAGGLHRVGGRGRIISDHGGGYRIGRAAADAALLAGEGSGPPTILESSFCEAFAISSVTELGGAVAGSRPEAIAALVPLVVDAAEGGDARAGEILAQGALDLAQLGVSAARNAGLQLLESPVFLGGGLMQSPVYFDRVTRALTDAELGGQVAGVSYSSAQGAALLARAVVLNESPGCGWVRG